MVARASTIVLLDVSRPKSAPMDLYLVVVDVFHGADSRIRDTTVRKCSQQPSTSLSWNYIVGTRLFFGVRASKQFANRSMCSHLGRKPFRLVSLLAKNG